MRPLLIRIFLPIAVVWIVTTAMHRLAFAQDASNALSKLQGSLTRLLDASEDTPGLVDPDDVVRLKKQVGFIQDRVAHRNSPISSDYISSLLHISDVITQAAQTKNTEESRAIIRDVVGDLDLKVGQSNSLNASDQPLRGQVSVTVHTRKGTQEDLGHIVYANPIRWQGKDPMFSFPKLSSPTGRSLPPGRYELVASKNGTISGRRFAEIGISGQDQADYDVSVP